MILKRLLREKEQPAYSHNGGDEGDWEEFQALGNIKQNALELESYCGGYTPLQALGIAGSLGRMKRVSNAKLRKAAQLAHEKKDG